MYGIYITSTPSHTTSSSSHRAEHLGIRDLTDAETDPHPETVTFLEPLFPYTQIVTPFGLIPVHYGLIKGPLHDPYPTCI